MYSVNWLMGGDGLLIMMVASKRGLSSAWWCIANRTKRLVRWSPAPCSPTSLSNASQPCPALSLGQLGGLLKTSEMSYPIHAAQHIPTTTPYTFYYPNVGPDHPNHRKVLSLVECWAVLWPLSVIDRAGQCNQGSCAI